MKIMVRRKTHEEYKSELAKINPYIEVVDTYINAKTKILHKCKIDGYEWSVLPNSILNGRGCPKCGGTMQKTHEEYVSEVATINSNIEVVGAYVSNKLPVLHRCKLDGYE